jgi:pyruvate/2-oxoglutarate dehydrogenase complex dihydrolipoamide dehydrogenase (E3) component
MAESFHELGLETTVIGPPPQVLKRLDADMAQLVQDELGSKGIRLSLGDEVKALEGDAQGKCAGSSPRKTLLRPTLFCWRWACGPKRPWLKQPA